MDCNTRYGFPLGGITRNNKPVWLDRVITGQFKMTEVNGNISDEKLDY